MRYFNADGGEAEMCGNGARCFARFANRVTGAEGSITFETPAGVIGARFEADLVTLQMSEPRDLRLNLSIDIGSDGRLAATDVAAALKGREKEPKDVARSVPVRIDARYVDLGTDRHGGGTYVLRYKWEGGGLFGGRSLRLLALAR